MKPYWSLQWENGVAWLIIGFVIRVTRQVLLAEQKRLSIPEVSPLLYMSLHISVRDVCSDCLVNTISGLSGSLRFSQFSGCWLVLSVYIIMSFDFPFVRLFGNFVITLISFDLNCFCFLFFSTVVYVFIFTSGQHDFHIRQCSWHLTVTNEFHKLYRNC